MIQKAITESVARFTRRGDDPRGVTGRYVWDSLRRFATRKAPAATPAPARPGCIRPGSRGSASAMATLAMASRQVRRIVRLEERANRLLVRWDRARRRAVRAKAQAHALLDEIIGIEHALTDAQLAELRRARGEASAAARPREPAASAVSAATTDVPNHPIPPQ